MYSRRHLYLRLGTFCVGAGFALAAFQNCSMSAFSPQDFADKPWGMFSFLSLSSTGTPSTMKSISRFEMLNGVRRLIGAAGFDYRDIAEMPADPKLAGFESAAVQSYNTSFIEARLGLAEKAAGLALRSPKVITCQPDLAQTSRYEGCVQSIIEAFAKRAYRRPLTAEETASLFQSYASGVNSANAELAMVPRPLLVGAHDGPVGLTVTGWALDPAWAKRTVEIHVYVDGAYVGNTFANVPRSDVNAHFAAEEYEGDHGFLYQLPERFADGRSHEVRVYAIAGGGDMPNPELAPARTVSTTSAGQPPAVPPQLGTATEEGLRAVFTRVLASPSFQLRSLSNLPAGGAVTTSLKLANRLAFYLTGTGPDDQLLGLAERGQLNDPKVYRGEVDRLLNTYSEDLSFNIFGQWFGFREYALRADITPVERAMLRESTLVFKELVDRNLNDEAILKPGFTFVDQTLAAHYGMRHPGGDFVKVASVERGGVLNQGAILRVTSPTDRTSPIKRGIWVQWNLLCRTIPAPDASIFQAIAEAQAQADPNWSVSERLEQHRRAGPSCNGCHQYMDPLGLALEMYNPLGQLRTVYPDGKPVITRAVLDGEHFDGVDQLIERVRGRTDFRACVTSRLVTAGLGRVVGESDRALMLRLAFSNLGLRDLITQVATSNEFRAAALEE